MKLSAATSIRCAFSLIEMAVVLIIIGLMSGLILQSERAARPSNCYVQTQAQLNGINQAIDTFVHNNNRYPSPAGRSLGASSVNYGKESLDPTVIDILPNGGQQIFAGALPFQALGLPDSFAADCWGNKFSYYVTGVLTSADASTGFPSISAEGVIRINSGTRSAPTSILTMGAYAVISHGEDGYGAVAKNYSGASHGWCTISIDPNTHIDADNCDGDNSSGNNYLYASTFNNGKNAGANYFDDLIIFSGKQNSNCNGTSYNVTWGGMSSSCGATVVAPNVPLANGAPSVGPISSSGLGMDTGSAWVKCVNGVMVVDPTKGYTCGTDSCTSDPLGHTPPVCGAGCTTDTLSWGPGGVCNAEFTGVPSGSLSPVMNNTNPGYTGTAQAACIAGAWSIDSGSATCGASVPASCNPTSAAWGGTCGAHLSGGADGAAQGPVSNTEPGYTGSASFTCVGGSWVTSGTPTCNAAPPACPSGTYTWGGGNCKATFPGVAEGATSAPQANVLPGYTGSAQASCLSGTISIGAATCDPVPPTDCPATNLHWAPGCDAVFPHTADGATASGVTNTAPGFSGVGSASCVGGSWQPASGSCNPIAPTDCPTSTISWGPGCSATFNTAVDGATDGPRPSTAPGFTGMGTMMCTGGSWVDAGSSCNPLPPGDCPAAHLSWYPGCEADFPYTVNSATSPTIPNTNPAYTGSASAVCQGGNWVSPSGTCTVSPTAVFCGVDGGCGNGGSGYTFYNDVVQVYCQPGKCKSTPGYSQYWNCGGVVPPGVQTYNHTWCAP